MYLHYFINSVYLKYILESKTLQHNGLHDKNGINKERVNIL